MSKFDDLLAELEQHQGIMAKAMGAEDGKEDDEDEYIRSMAGGDEDGDGIPDNKDEDEKDEDEIMGKSMLLEIDGEQYNAIDGSVIVKALSTMKAKREEEMEEVSEVFAGLGATIKSLTAAVERLGRDNTMLKAKVAEIGGRPRERRSHLSVVEPVKGGERNDGADAGKAKEMILAKAQTMFDAGKLSAMDISTLDVGFRNPRINQSDQALMAVLDKIAREAE